MPRGRSARCRGSASRFSASCAARRSSKPACQSSRRPAILARLRASRVEHAFAPGARRPQAAAVEVQYPDSAPLAQQDVVGVEVRMLHAGVMEPPQATADRGPARVVHPPGAQRLDQRRAPSSRSVISSARRRSRSGGSRPRPAPAPAGPCPAASPSSRSSRKERVRSSPNRGYRSCAMRAAMPPRR